MIPLLQSNKMLDGSGISNKNRKNRKRIKHKITKTQKLILAFLIQKGA